MIVVDSSVWIDHLRGNLTPQVRMLAGLIWNDDAILVGDLVLCEVLQGIPTERKVAQIERDLREFDMVQMVDDDVAIRAAEHFRTLRRRGVTIRSTVDLLIGAYCIRQRHRLLHRDRDFDAMEQHLGLAVLHP